MDKMKTFAVFIFFFNCCTQSADSFVEKRSHNHGPLWLDECWDHGSGHFANPLCELLTSPTTSTSTQAPTTTARTCNYEAHNDSFIQHTDYISNVQGTESGSVHVTNELQHCQSVCANSLLQNNYECWAFTYNSTDRCYLYYYPGPLHYVPNSNPLNGTTLYIKRCSDDPFGNLTHFTVSPIPTAQSHITTSTPKVETMTSTTTAPVFTGSPSPTATSTTAGHVTGRDTNSFRLHGATQQNPDSCYFLGQTYLLGDQWQDTCRYNCSCTNTTSNTATCTDICPANTNNMPNCQIVKQPGYCCETLDCSGLATSSPPRTCVYEAYNDSSVGDTDFGIATSVAVDSNDTFNEPIHILVDQLTCERICDQSVVNERFECRAYTFNPVGRCHLYNYFRPLNFLQSASNQTGTTLSIKRCSNDQGSVSPTTTPIL